jgi:hypothetical protein
VPALEGVSGLHLITFDGGTEGYAPLQTGTEIVEAATKAGVQRVTVLREISLLLLPIALLRAECYDHPSKPSHKPPHRLEPSPCCNRMYS